MTNPHKISELEANALADGELTGEAADETRRAIETDDQLRGLVAWRDTLNDRLHRIYDGVLTDALPARTARLLRPAVSFALPSGSRRFAAAVAIAVVAAGCGYLAGVGGIGTADAPAQFAQLALGAHQVYASEVRHPVEVAGAESDHLSKWLGKRLGLDFVVPDIKDTGFTLVGGRLLAEGQRPAALLMYEDAAGRRVTLYIEKWQPAGETALRYASSAELNSYYWIDSPFACAVSGDLAGDQLKAVAQRIYTALAKA